MKKWLPFYIGWFCSVAAGGLLAYMIYVRNRKPADTPADSVEPSDGG
jgi:hypothetical protein